MKANSPGTSVPVVSILPDQLTPVIGELCEVSNLAEFLYMSVQRVQDTESDLSFSYGEGDALITLMKSVAERLTATTAKLTDIKFGWAKEVHHD
jgi:hypothetical protein